MNRWKTKFWWWILHKVPLKGLSGRTGNRFYKKGMLGPIEVTITDRDTREPDGYSREELLRMLQLIRSEEERHQWKVPEPVACVYCGHVSPSIKDVPEYEISCPVSVKPSLSSKSMKCSCDKHAYGLVLGWRNAVDKKFTITPRPYSL